MSDALTPAQRYDSALLAGGGDPLSGRIRAAMIAAIEAAVAAERARCAQKCADAAEDMRLRSMVVSAPIDKRNYELAAQNFDTAAAFIRDVEAIDAAVAAERGDDP